MKINESLSSSQRTERHKSCLFNNLKKKKVFSFPEIQSGSAQTVGAIQGADLRPAVWQRGGTECLWPSYDRLWPCDDPAQSCAHAHMSDEYTQKWMDKNKHWKRRWRSKKQTHEEIKAEAKRIMYVQLKELALEQQNSFRKTKQSCLW